MERHEGERDKIGKYEEKGKNERIENEGKIYKGK